MRVEDRPRCPHLGAVAVYLESFAGAGDRFDVSQLMIRGLIRRRLNNRWYLTYNPIITANWNAPADQRWVVPLGGGIGRTFSAAGQPVALAAEAVGLRELDGLPIGEAQAVAVVGAVAVEAPALLARVREGLGDLACGDHRADRVTVPDRLSERDDVGHDVRRLEAPHVAPHATEADLDLVRDADRASRSGDPVRLLEVARRWLDLPTAGEDGLDE